MNGDLQVLNARAREKEGSIVLNIAAPLYLRLKHELSGPHRQTKYYQEWALSTSSKSHQSPPPPPPNQQDTNTCCHDIY